MRAVLALAVLLPPFTAPGVRAQGVLHHPPPPPEEAVCDRRKRLDPPWHTMLVPSYRNDFRLWQANLDRLVEQVCESFAARAIAPVQSFHAPVAEQDPRTMAEAYIAARMIYTGRPDITPDGKAAEVRAIVGGQTCTVSLTRDDPGAPWRVSAFACGA